MLADNIALICLIFSLIILAAAWYIASMRRKKEEALTSYTEGLLAIVEGDRKKAIKLLRQSALVDPSNIRAFIILGDLLREAGSVKRAVDVHRRLLVRTGMGTGLRLRTIKSLALDYLELADYEAVVDVAKRGLELSKQDPLLLDLLLTSYEALGSWSEAALTAERLESATASDMRRKRALYKLEEAKKELQLGRGHNARMKFREALKIDENCFYSYIAIGDSYRADERWDDAIKWYREFMLHFPQRGYLVYDRIETSFYEKGDFSKTIDVYTAHLKDNPEDLALAGALAELYAKMGEYAQAAEILEKLYDILGTSQKLALLYYYKQTGKDEKVTRVIEELVKRDGRRNKFICKVCEYQTDEILWRCPRCNSWDSFNL